MDIRQITHQQTIAVRHQVLWPNKLPTFCYVEGDEQGIHFGAFKQDHLVCVASIYIDANSARLRKYATCQQFQGQGFGSAVLTTIINHLKAHDIETFWCDARESAVGFYQRFGMQCSGERFYKSDVGYFKMSMSLI